MGLLDNLFGGSGSSSYSPLFKALLLMLAAKVAADHMGHKPAAAPAPTAPGGGDGRITSGVLAGMPTLESIVDHFRSAGKDTTAQSWVGPGANTPIEPTDAEHALGPAAIDQLQKQSGLPRDQLLQQLATMLPQAIDQLTPNGRLPTSEERKTW